MNNQEVVAVLKECKQMLDGFASKVLVPSEEEKNDYQRCEASLPDNVRILIQEAKEMKWPFVPERWQYKQAVDPEDKTNLQDIINPRIQDLLVLLKASIVVAESFTAAAIVFLIDRFLYWADASRRLLSVAKALHKTWPSTPIAPQVVIRQARISVNSGKLLKAEHILSSLISNNGATGTWLYSKESDRLLVQSVCIQIRGQILQKLGMWYEAAELIWASLVGFFELPTPDKKGISTSLGALADVFISMSEKDYQRFRKSSHVGLALLETFDHRLLSAAEACKLAATFSLYTPLFVLTNLNIRGTCLLSYSLSEDCPADKKHNFFSEAKKSFEIGLLTKKRGDHVTSKQELYSFVKAAFCLANVHKWLHSETAQNEYVERIYREAMEKLVKYNMLPDKCDKGDLADNIMSLVFTIREHFNVQPFQNSEDCCYVPDSYRDCVTKNIVIGKLSFNNLLDMYSQHHNAVCEVFDRNCSNNATHENSGACITALKTTDTISTLDITPTSSVSNPGRSSDKSARRQRFVRSSAMSHSVEEDKSKNVRSHSSSNSNSSFSWECIPEHNEDSSKVENPCSLDNICDIVCSETNEYNEIPLQNLSIQKSRTCDKSNHTPIFKKPTAGPLPNHANHSNSVIGNTVRKNAEISSTSILVPNKSCEMENNNCLDYDPFVVLDLLNETECFTDNKPNNVLVEQHALKNNFTENDGKDLETIDTSDYVLIGTHHNMSVHPDPFGYIAGQTLFHGIDIEGETKDATEDVDIEKHNKISRPLDPSSGIVGQKLFHGIDVDGETKDATDDVEVEKHDRISWPPDPSSGIVGQKVFHGIDVDGETKDATEDVAFEKQDKISRAPIPSSGIVGKKVFHGIDVGDTKDATEDVDIEKHGNISKPSHLSCDIMWQRLINGIDVDGETKDATEDVDIEKHGSRSIQLGHSSCILGQRLFYGIDVDGDTKDGTEDVISEKHRNILISQGSSRSFAEQKLFHGIDVEGDTKDATEDISESGKNAGEILTSCSAPVIMSHNSPVGACFSREDSLEKHFLTQQWSFDSDQSSLDMKSSVYSRTNASSTEKEEDKCSLSLSSSHGSSSWSNISQKSLSDSYHHDSGSPNSSTNSFVIIRPESTEQMRQARSLDVKDYEKLLSGVSHDWLLERMKCTGVFSFKHSHQTKSALLLKFSKMSELWTAQETVVHFGGDLDVKNEGKQRKAFWIYFLHQDEILGRYVGKAYKKQKELLYHFVDVERQMTAQYYVTEFNKRLYELNIPTQILYIPSAVLLIMENRIIKGCVSVEPYILGEFVKLTNNTKTVRMQYEATKYGLAFGHFAYEFSDFSDIVVDLQGWVTGSDKGEAIIYLTDPQIHSVKDTPICQNFGNAGINMFFTDQHKECNKICHSLSLTRPDIIEMEKSSRTRTRKVRQQQYRNSKRT